MGASSKSRLLIMSRASFMWELEQEKLMNSLSLNSEIAIALLTNYVINNPCTLRSN